MKILRVISSVDKANGGPINGLLNSSTELVVRGHEITVLSLDDPADSHVASFPFPLVTFKSSLGALKYSAQFKSWLDENISNFDVVVIHGIWQYHSYAASKACIKHNVPYVLFTHGMLDPWFTETNILGRIKKTIYWKLFEKKSVNQANRVFFTSQEEQRLAQIPFSPYKARGQVVAYGSPLPTTNKEQAKTEFFELFPHLIDKPFLLFLSRIHEKKGIDILIEAMGQLVYKFPNVQLAIAGPGNERLKDTLIQRANAIGFDKNISWLGMLDGSLKWGAFYSSTAFVLPSHQENFGIVVSEALSTGTPVLITDKVNICKEISESGAGIIASDTTEGVKQALEKWLLLDESQISAMRENALQCYQQNFSLNSAVDDLEKYLHEVVAESSVNNAVPTSMANN